MDWDWWTSPSFRYPVTPHHAVDAVTHWLRSLPKAYCALGLQHGPCGDRLHVHCMIGGTGRRRDTEFVLRGSWRRGNLDLKAFHPALGGIEYMVRQADEIELLGQPVLYRPRR
jgi:hypothetical protein